MGGLMLRRTAMMTLLLWTSLVFVATADDHQAVRELVHSGEIKSLTSILELLPAQFHGRLLEVELENEHGSYVYELEMLDDNGTVWEIEVNASTGELLETEIED
jgi:uncharacterized membrane protein YkoI